MNRDCIFEDFYVSDLNFDLMNGKLSFSAYDDENMQMHQVSINRISKIFWETDQRIALSKQKWILYQLEVRDTKALKQKKCSFRRTKIKVNDDWLSGLVSEYEFNINIEFGDCLWCILKAEEITLDNITYQL